jgi:hypothetical protein
VFVLAMGNEEGAIRACYVRTTCVSSSDEKASVLGASCGDDRANAGKVEKEARVIRLLAHGPYRVLSPAAWFLHVHERERMHKECWREVDGEV